MLRAIQNEHEALKTVAESTDIFAFGIVIGSIFETTLLNKLCALKRAVTICKFWLIQNKYCSGLSGKPFKNYPQMWTSRNKQANKA